MIAENVRAHDLNSIVEEHLPVARSLAARLKRRYRWLDVDELYSYALWGLIAAVQSYQARRGTPLAWFLPRKAMFLAIDQMRKDRLVFRIQAKDKSSPYRQRARGGEDMPMCDVPDARWAQGEQDLETRDLVQNMFRHIAPKDQRLLMLYYADGLTFVEIARVYDTCESTICLRHKRLLHRLRSLTGLTQA